MQDLWSSVTQLADLFENAPSMPLMRERVRIDKRDADKLAAVIEADVRDAVDRGTLRKEVGYEVLSVTTQMREDLRNAYSVPMTDQVRVPRSRAAELGQALRAVIGAW